jgi:hypothetical protein
VREVLAADYLLYAQARKIYDRMSTLLRAKISPERLDEIWWPWLHHHADLETTMQALVAKISER